MRDESFVGNVLEGQVHADDIDYGNLHTDATSRSRCPFFLSTISSRWFYLLYRTNLPHNHELLYILYILVYNFTRRRIYLVLMSEFLEPEPVQHLLQ